MGRKHNIEDTKIDKLARLMMNYDNTQDFIQQKQKMLKMKLSNPQIRTMRGFDYFFKKESEIQKLIDLHNKISFSIDQLSEKDRQLLFLIGNGDSSVDISKKLQMGLRTVFRRVDKILNHLEESINENYAWER